MHRKSVVCSSNGSVSLKSLKVPDARSESDCLIEIQCAALNPLDFAMSNGYGSNVLEKLRGTEFVLGQEFSGICVEAGANVFDIKEGDEVWGAVDPWSKCGTLSEYVRVNEVDIARKPQVLSHSLSAALPFAIMTVWRSVIEKARKRRSNNALILGKGNLGTCIHALLQEFVPECVMEMRGREGYDGPEKFDIVVDCSSSIGKPLVMEDFVSAGGFCVTFNGPWLPLTTEHGVIKGLRFLFPLFSSLYFMVRDVGCWSKAVGAKVSALDQSWLFL